MRASMTGVFLIIVTGMMSACASSTGAKPDAQAGAQADKVADARVCVMHQVRGQGRHAPHRCYAI